MKSLAIILLLVFSTGAACRYADQFGAVYEWKKEGFGQTVDLRTNKNFITLLNTDSLVLVDYLGTSLLTEDRYARKWILSTLPMFSMINRNRCTYC